MRQLALLLVLQQLLLVATASPSLKRTVTAKAKVELPVPSLPAVKVEVAVQGDGAFTSASTKYSLSLTTTIGVDVGVAEVKVGGKLVGEVKCKTEDAPLLDALRDLRNIIIVRQFDELLKDARAAAADLKKQLDKARADTMKHMDMCEMRGGVTRLHAHFTEKLAPYLTWGKHGPLFTVLKPLLSSSIDKMLAYRGPDGALYKWHQDTAAWTVEKTAGAAPIKLKDIAHGAALSDVARYLKEHDPQPAGVPKNAYAVKMEDVPSLRTQTFDGVSVEWPPTDVFPRGTIGDIQSAASNACEARFEKDSCEPWCKSRNGQFYCQHNVPSIKAGRLLAVVRSLVTRFERAVSQVLRLASSRDATDYLATLSWAPNTDMAVPGSFVITAGSPHELYQQFLDVVSKTSELLDAVEETLRTPTTTTTIFVEELARSNKKEENEGFRAKIARLLQDFGNGIKRSLFGGQGVTRHLNDKDMYLVWSNDESIEAYVVEKLEKLQQLAKEDLAKSKLVELTFKGTWSGSLSAKAKVKKEASIEVKASASSGLEIAAGGAYKSLPNSFTIDVTGEFRGLKLSGQITSTDGELTGKIMLEYDKPVRASAKKLAEHLKKHPEAMKGLQKAVSMASKALMAGRQRLSAASESVLRVVREHLPGAVKRLFKEVKVSASGDGVKSKLSAGLEIGKDGSASVVFKVEGPLSASGGVKAVTQLRGLPLTVEATTGYEIALSTGDLDVLGGGGGGYEEEKA